jgi:hypothetical protein
MGYNSGTKKITAPVGIADVQHALGDASTDVGSLCKSANINMWAKYKPVVKNLINTYPQLKSDLTWKNINGSGGLGTDAWFMATAGNFGLTPLAVSYSTDDNRMLTALNTLANEKIDGGLNGWTYTRPSGGSSSPYRLIDFNGYYADAPEPVKSVSGMPIVTASSSSSWSYSVQMMGSAINDVTGDIDARDYLLASDAIGTCYIGIAIFKMYQGTYQAMAWSTDNYWTGIGLASSGDGTVTAGTNRVSATFAKDTTYYAIPVFFSEQLPQEETLGSVTTKIYGYSKQPALTGTPVKKIWTVPFTDFVPFTTVLASTSQRWGLPTATSHVIGMVGYITKLYLDRTTDAAYYNARGSVVVEFAMVNELWNESNQYTSWPSGSYVGYTSQTLNIQTTGVNIPLNNDSYYSPALTSGHTWNLVVIVDGEITKILLRQYQDPNAPVSQ